MSSNNQLVIIRSKKWKNNQFEVHHDFCVDNEFKPDKESLLKRFRKLQEAIIFAKQYCREEIVEYGIHICDSCLSEE